MVLWDGDGAYTAEHDPLAQALRPEDRDAYSPGVVVGVLLAGGLLLILTYFFGWWMYCPWLIYLAGIGFWRGGWAGHGFAILVLLAAVVLFFPAFSHMR